MHSSMDLGFTHLEMVCLSSSDTISFAENVALNHEENPTKYIHSGSGVGGVHLSWFFCIDNAVNTGVMVASDRNGWSYWARKNTVYLNEMARQKTIRQTTHRYSIRLGE